jgi:hypothetical protein
MAPYAIIHLVIFFALMLLSLWFNASSVYLILLVGSYFAFIQLANYPLLTIRDVYLHAAPTETIVANGTLTYSKDPIPSSWPDSFNLHATLSIVLGGDLINTNYILYLTVIVVFTLVLYSFVKELEMKGYRLAKYSPILFLCLFSNHLFNGFNHYSRTALGFTFLFLFFFAFMYFRDRRGYILQLLLALATLTTHPFQAIALMTFLGSYCVLAHRFRRVTFVLFSIVASVGWFLFNSPLVFADAIHRLQELLSPQYTSSLTVSFATGEALPWIGVILRDFFKYSFVALFAVVSFIVFIFLYRKRSSYEDDTLTTSLISFLLMPIVSLLILPPDWKIWRSTAFAAFPLAFTSFAILEKIIADKHALISSPMYRLSKVRIRRVLLASLLLYITVLSAVVMVLQFEKNFYLGEIWHPSEESSFSFFFSHDHNSAITYVSWRTCVYSAYPNYNRSHQTFRLWDTELKEIGKNESKLLRSLSGFINQSQSVERGIRDEFDLGRVAYPEALLNIIDEELILPKFNQIYSNDYYRLYSRP